MEKGADISGWQAPYVNLDGLDFCMVKASEGVNVPSNNHVEQIAEVRNKGLVLGTYHFADGGNPIDEANYYLTQNDRRNGELQAVDAEAGFWNTPNPVDWLAKWWDEVYNATGNKPGLYIQASKLYDTNFKPLIDRDCWLWLAAWNGQNSPAVNQWSTWAMWQYADTSQTGGDADYFNGDINTLRAYGQNARAEAVTYYYRDAKTGTIIEHHNDGKVTALTSADYSALGSPKYSNLVQYLRDDRKGTIVGIVDDGGAATLTFDEYNALGTPAYNNFTHYIRDNSNSTIYGVEPDGTALALTLADFTALGSPAVV